MKYFIYAAAVLLTLVHQDVWNWNDPRLVFGFMPTGLAYHVFYTLAASALWAAAVFLAWPRRLEAFAEGRSDAIDS